MCNVVCNKCGEKDSEKLVKGGRGVLRSLCKSCKNIQAAAWRDKNVDRVKKYVEKDIACRKLRRQSPEGLPQTILEDSRCADRKKGFENDMTLEFIEKLIAPGCSYCEDTELRMTLDRIDNSMGHTQDNVVSACIRCNYVRKTMPYKAWLLVAKKMKIAREKGLFGDWTGRAR